VLQSRDCSLITHDNHWRGCGQNKTRDVFLAPISADFHLIEGSLISDAQISNMRLLHATSFTFRDFHESEIETQPFAILSHCWTHDPNEAEVTYQQVLSQRGSLHAPGSSVLYGWWKIQDCCQIARESGLQWVWVDTCCINKDSSAELSEAINSMYRWYQKAKQCYVFLDDVTQGDVHDGVWQDEFRRSRWFTRGWTLQELLAPTADVRFSRVYIGDRTRLARQISEATGINVAYISRRNDILSASVAERMSWAASRKTTRKRRHGIFITGNL
jgi:hypothetical protein